MSNKFENILYGSIIKTDDFQKIVNKNPRVSYFDSSTNTMWNYSNSAKNWLPFGNGGGSSVSSFSSLIGQPSDNNNLNTVLNNKEDKSNKNQNNGYAGLDNTGKVLANQIPVLPDYKPILIIISTNGQINFTIPTAPVNFSNPFLFLNGVLQTLGTDYTISGNSLSWTHPNLILEISDQITFYYK